MSDENHSPRNLSTPSSEEVQLARVLKELLGPDALKSIITEVLSRHGQAAGADKAVPLGWSKESNAPWYKEQFALETKAIVDQVWETKKVAVLFYNEDPNWEKKPETVKNNYYLRLNQGWMFLRDYMEEVTEEFPNGKYKTLRERMLISKTENESGTVIRLKTSSETKALRARLVEEEQVETKHEFFDDVFEWVTAAKVNDKIKWDGLALTPDDMARIQTIFDNPVIGECFLRQIAPDKIILMKHKELE